MTQWLRAFTTLPKDPYWLPAPIVGGSQRPLSPALPVLSPSAGLHGHCSTWHVFIKAYTHNHKCKTHKSSQKILISMYLILKSYLFDGLEKKKTRLIAFLYPESITQSQSINCKLLRMYWLGWQTYFPKFLEMSLGCIWDCIWYYKKWVRPPSQCSCWIPLTIFRCLNLVYGVG